MNLETRKRRYLSASVIIPIFQQENQISSSKLCNQGSTARRQKTQDLNDSPSDLEIHILSPKRFHIQIPVSTIILIQHKEPKLSRSETEYFILPNKPILLFPILFILGNVLTRVSQADQSFPILFTLSNCPANCLFYFLNNPH